MDRGLAGDSSAPTERMGKLSNGDRSEQERLEDAGTGKGDVSTKAAGSWEVSECGGRRGLVGLSEWYKSL